MSLVMLLILALRKRRGIPAGEPVDQAEEDGCKKAPLQGLFRKTGSPGRTRTSDQLINSQPLYQLSYRGMAGSRISRGPEFWSSHWAKSRAGRGQVVANSLFFMQAPCESARLRP